MLQKHFILGFLLLLLQQSVVTSQTVVKQPASSPPVASEDSTTIQQAPLTIPLQSQPSAPASASAPAQPKPLINKPSSNEQRTVPQRSSVPAPAHPNQTPPGHSTSPSGQPQPPPKQLTKPGPVKRMNPNLKGPLYYQPTGNSKVIQSLINQYNGQYIQKPSSVLRSPLPSSSLQSLMNSITSSFRLRPNAIGRRSGKGSPLDNALYSLNSIPDSTGGGNGAPTEFNLNNINAINEMISTALNTMNQGNPMNPGNLPTGNSGLMSTVGSFLSSNIGKPSKKLFLEFPKAIYKSIGEKISGAGEAAVSATVPLKDSFFSTLKSFYSYLKPNRVGSQSGESLAAAAAAAAAGFTGQSQDASSNSASQNSGNGNNGVFNFKRRQSMESPYVYHFAAAQPQISSGNQRQQVPQQNWQQQQPQQQWNGNFANFPKQQQQQQQQSSNSGNINSNSQFIHQQAVEQYNRQPVQFSSNQFDPTTSAQFNQALQQALFGMSEQQPQQQQSSSKVIPYGTRMQPLESQQIQVQAPHHQQHHSGLYARSKELFNKIARKAAPRIPASQQQQQQQPQIAQFPGQFLGHPASPNQQLSSQILTKVQSKLGTLPAAYNQQQQHQQQQQQVQAQPQQAQSSSPLGQWSQSVLLSNPPSQPGQQSQWTQNTAQQQQQNQPQQQQQPNSLSSFYTQQPINQQQQQPSNSQQQQTFNFQSDQSQQQQSQQQQLGQYIGQLAGTSSVTSSSTPSSISGVTSTSVSISKSISSSSSSNQQPSSGMVDQSMMVESNHDQGMMSDQAAADGPLYYFESGPGSSGAGHQEGHASEDSAAAQHQPDSN